MLLTSYVHLSLEERERMFGLLKQGKSLRFIGKVLGRNHTSLAREIKRNSKYGRAYVPCKAYARYKKVTVCQRRKGPLKNPGVYLYVRENLRKGLSPQTIAGRLPLDIHGESITPETIYQYIYETEKRRKQFVSRLTRSHSKRKTHTGRSVQKTPRIPFATSIDSRHEKINTRHSIGHWETLWKDQGQQDGLYLSRLSEKVGM